MISPFKTLVTLYFLVVITSADIIIPNTSPSLANHEPQSNNKYFHEANFHPHYDGRFATKPLPYDKKQTRLRALIRAYLTTMQSVGVETWLMHGTLLGWYWNRRIMPWDSDLDVMLSEHSLYHLADNMNMTTHHFEVPGDERAGKYLLEVNPHCREASADEENVIDARWIDVDSGLFIDLTTLRRNLTAMAEGRGEEMMVKDRHRYQVDEIFPLRESVFEGVRAMVPFAYGDVLVEEYGEQALSGTRYESHWFDGRRGKWVPTAVLIPGRRRPV